MKKLGIIQGRLSTPVDGHIQEFPKNNWQQEFNILFQLGLSHVEWIITETSFSSNPIFHDGLLKGYPISTICCDQLIHSEINDRNFLKEKLEPVCHAARTHKIKSIGIPLLEASSLEDKSKRESFVGNILELHSKFPELIFTFEAELKWQEVLEIVNENNQFKLTYDTGNITSHCGPEIHEEYLENVFHKIDNIHLKDRKRFSDGWKTVFPSTGDTKFNMIFKKLKELGYNGNYTMQTARSVDGLEKETILYHKLILETLYDRT